MGWYIKTDDLEFQSLWVGGALILGLPSIDGQLSMQDMHVAGGIYVPGARAHRAAFRRVTSPELGLGSAQIANDIELSQISLETLWLEKAKALRVTLSHGTSFGGVSDEDAAALCAPVRPNADISGADRYGLSDATIAGWGFERTGNGAPVCLDRVNAVGAVIENGVYISGIIETMIDLTEAHIPGTLTLAGANIRFGSRSCLWMRNLTVDTIVIDPDVETSAQVGGPVGALRTGPVFVGSFGARYRTIRPSEPIGDRSNREIAARRALAMLNGVSGMACTFAGIVHTGGGGAAAVAYRPEIYDALATGYETTGNLDLARMIRIEKNRAYAASLADTDQWHRNAVPRLVYFLADHVNGFGHRNLNAVLWLGGFILFGYVLARIGEDRMAQLFCALRSRFTQNRAAADASDTLAENSSGQQDQILTPVRSPQMQGANRLMFSLDRAIPTLSLDSDFQTHRGKPIGPILSTYFYFQRIVCFFIVILMLAGAFDIFQ